MFHRILPKDQIDLRNAYSSIGTLISLEFFEALLERLKSLSFEFISVSEIETTKDRQNRVVLTFDDGYTDNLEFVLGSLERFNVKATFYPVVNPCRYKNVLPLDLYYQCIDEQIMDEAVRYDFIAGTTKKEFYWKDQNEQLKMIHRCFGYVPNECRVSYLDSQQLKYIHSLGHEIGSHGLTHTLSLADSMSEESVLQEMKESKKWLEEIIGAEISSYAFPANCYNLKMIELAKDAGYKNTCLVTRKEEGTEALPSYERIFIKTNSIDHIVNQLKLT